MPEAVPGQQQVAPAEQGLPVQAEAQVRTEPGVLRRSAAGQAGPSPEAAGSVRAMGAPERVEGIPRLRASLRGAAQAAPRHAEPRERAPPLPGQAPTATPPRVPR